MPGSDIIGDGPEDEATNAGDAMEEGWLAKSQGSSFKRTLEVWGFLAQCGLKIVKVRTAKGDDPNPNPNPNPNPSPNPHPHPHRSPLTFHPNQDCADLAWALAVGGVGAPLLYEP